MGLWYYVCAGLSIPLNICVLFAYSQRNFPLIAKIHRTRDWRAAIGIAILGAYTWPMTVPVFFFATGRYRHGLMPPSAAESARLSAQAHQKIVDDVQAQFPLSIPPGATIGITIGGPRGLKQ